MFTVTGLSDCPEVIYVLIALLGHGYSLVAELVFGWSPILICRTQYVVQSSRTNGWTDERMERALVIINSALFWNIPLQVYEKNNARNKTKCHVLINHRNFYRVCDLNQLRPLIPSIVCYLGPFTGRISWRSASVLALGRRVRLQVGSPPGLRDLPLSTQRVQQPARTFQRVLRSGAVDIVANGLCHRIVHQCGQQTNVHYKFYWYCLLWWRQHCVFFCVFVNNIQPLPEKLRVTNAKRKKNWVVSYTKFTLVLIGRARTRAESICFS